MPNHVTNVLTLHGESDQIRAMLEAIQYDDLGIGSVDFNKIIPMPESLNIEAGSQTSTGLKAYQDFIEVYTLGGTIHQDDLENIPRKSEDAFLRQRSDIRQRNGNLEKPLGTTFAYTEYRRGMGGVTSIGAPNGIPTATARRK